MEKEFMSDFESDDEKLIYLLKNDPIEFMKNCLHNFRIMGDFCSICKYVQLSILSNKGNELTNSEFQLLHQLEKKYKNININHLIDRERQIDKMPDVTDFNKFFKNLSRGIHKSIQENHEKNPLGGAAALLEYTKAIATSFREERGIRYNYKNNKELFECISNFNGKKFNIAEGLNIKLKPRGFIHIVVGHLDKHLIPRKGKQVTFSKVDNWQELLALIEKVIILLSTELIEHYRLRQSGFNKFFEYENCKYGIHLSKNQEIKTFYELEY